MSIADYHQHPALSSSGARRLLPPSTPARFRWERDHPRDPTAAFDLGHAAHTMVLGDGEQLVCIEATDWRTKDAKEKRDDARHLGMVPLLRKDYDQAAAMAAALRDNHPRAAALFSDGQAEVSRFWTDPNTGAELKTRFDWLTSDRSVIVEYKTAISADPDEFRRSVARYGYHQQAAWYIDTLAVEGIDAAFVFVVQEKTPPYLVSIVELDAMAITVGQHWNQKAIDLYAECVAADSWPGYSGDVVQVSLPPWAEAAYVDDVAPDEIEVA